MTGLPLQQEHLWDVAIIGAGMGGGFAAYALANAGRDVLLIDLGNEERSPASETGTTNVQDIRLAESKWPTLTAFEIDGITSRVPGPFGAGIGGSTNLYAAALERFDNRDIDSDPGSPHPTGAWPIRYDDLLPYYERAEMMLHVCGTPDPLNPNAFDHIAKPPPLGRCDADFFQLFRKNGLHPYRLHVGIRYRPGCDECLGRSCCKDCRADVRSVLAESQNKPTIMARTEVLRLEATPDRVTRAIVLKDNEQIAIQAKVFVLAAGAIHTPKLLLQSRDDHWPDGLANRSGLVGRNLMFHAQQGFILWPRKKLDGTGPRKCLAFTDFYEVDGQRCGSVQSTGLTLGYGEYLVHLYRLFDRSAAKRMKMVRPLLRIPAMVTTKRLGQGTLFVCLIEDKPYPENRVVLDDNEADGVRVKYNIKDELRERVTLFRRLLKERLRGCRMFILPHDVELNYGHPCGTCVMSNDPSTGVIDRNGRAHGIANLFIADASFMPSSAATNPSLTIAANALRISDEINRVLEVTSTD